MTTINNLTIEQMREIVEGAPEGATHFVGSTYLKLIGAAWWQALLQEWNHDANCMVRRWKGESIELMKTWGEVLKLNDLRTTIAEHDTDNITDIRNHVSPSTKVVDL